MTFGREEGMPVPVDEAAPEVEAWTTRLDGRTSAVSESVPVGLTLMTPEPVAVVDSVVAVTGATATSVAVPLVKPEVVGNRAAVAESIAVVG